MDRRLNYRIAIEEKASKEAQGIPAKHRTAIDKRILALASNPRPHGAKKLTEKEGCRLRVGNYRILYTIDDEMKAVVIYRIRAKGKRTYK
jgi:mRNA interferase RelE/StbE